jgi:hypothetical protein
MRHYDIGHEPLVTQSESRLPGRFGSQGFGGQIGQPTVNTLGVATGQTVSNQFNTGNRLARVDV